MQSGESTAVPVSFSNSSAVVFASTGAGLVDASTMRIAVRNPGRQLVPNVAVTVQTKGAKPGDGVTAFGQKAADSRLADPNRPVWILEGESTDPYYNFGKVIMYMDKDMYRIYWKLVHNRAGEYFYNAMCAYHWAKTADGSFSAVAPNLVVGVNDKTNRAALGGRYSSQFIETKYADDYFTLSHLSRMSD